MVLSFELSATALNVCLTGDLEAWLDFFADAVIVSATQAVDTTKQLIDLASEDREKISGLGRTAPSTLRVHRVLMEQPIATAKWLVKKTKWCPDFSCRDGVCC